MRVTAEGERDGEQNGGRDGEQNGGRDGEQNGGRDGEQNGERVLVTVIACADCLRNRRSEFKATGFGVCTFCKEAAFVGLHTAPLPDHLRARDVPMHFVLRPPFANICTVNWAVGGGSTVCLRPGRELLDSTNASAILTRCVHEWGVLIDPETCDSHPLDGLGDEWIREFREITAELPCVVEIDGRFTVVTLGE